FFFFSSRRRHTRLQGDWSSDVCSSDLPGDGEQCSGLFSSSASGQRLAMSSDGGPGNIPPFPPDYRAAGLLLHVTSLPSPYGIGRSEERRVGKSVDLGGRSVMQKKKEIS